jgi:hypothetical protein
VPSLAANFRKSIEAGIQKKGAITEKLFRRALKLAYAYNKEGYNKGEGAPFWQKPILKFYDKLIFSKVRASFAGNMDFFIGGGALLDIELQRFFLCHRHSHVSGIWFVGSYSRDFVEHAVRAQNGIIGQTRAAHGYQNNG